LKAPDLILHRPAALCAAVSFMHLLGLACAFIALEGLALGLVCAGVLLSWGAETLRLWRQSGLRLVGRPDGGLALAGATGAVTVEGGLVPAPWLAVLELRDGQGRRTAILVTPDRVEAEAFRRLRVWLRWHSAFASDRPN